MSINVLTSQDKEIFSIYITKQKEIPDERHVNLFLIKSDNDYNLENETCDNLHYCLIKNKNRLLSNEISRNNLKDVCINSGTHYYKKSKYEEHLKECKKYVQNSVLFKTPSKNYIQFEHIKRSQKIPYVIYADFKSIIKKFNLVSSNPNDLWTENKGNIQLQLSVLQSLIEKKILDIKTFIGYNAVKKFTN